MKTIELTAPHEHAGREYSAGDTIDVSDNDAAWLIWSGKAKSTAPPPSHSARAPTLKAIESNQDKEQQA